MTNRSRDKSDALTEVRTVLSRAETAMEMLVNHSYRGNVPRQFFKVENHRLVADGPPRLDAGEVDPHTEAMYYALERVVHELSRWRRAGKKRSR